MPKPRRTTPPCWTWRTDGAVRIRREDGRCYVRQPEPYARFPLDVKGVYLDVTTDEIVTRVREGQERHG